ncbi:MAG: GNAT family N-acetyltransferase [Alphaproteobacteria bacterium]|nr:GNAT family N-acetyltransferase [Alphaproteobacteria bacterium]
MQILHPIPSAALPAAAALWRAHFGAFGWPAQVRPGQGVVALDAGHGVLGVMGLRDSQGGLAASDLAAPPWLFRPAPATADLVIDGLAVRLPRRGIGRALVVEALRQAGLRQRPGLRAEVRARNRDALAFYDSLGFAEEARGQFGLPWWGQVRVLRLAAS